MSNEDKEFWQGTVVDFQHNEDTSKYRYRWRYDENDAPQGCCYDCRMKYHHFPDMHLPNEVWFAISPAPAHEPAGGLLCPTCMANRLQYLNLWYPTGFFFLKEGELSKGEAAPPADEPPCLLPPFDVELVKQSYPYRLLEAQKRELEKRTEGLVRFCLVTYQDYSMACVELAYHHKDRYEPGSTFPRTLVFCAFVLPDEVSDFAVVGTFFDETEGQHGTKFAANRDELHEAVGKLLSGDMMQGVWETYRLTKGGYNDWD